MTFDLDDDDEDDEVDGDDFWCGSGCGDDDVG